MLILMIIVILLQSYGIISQEILSSASDTDIGQCSCSYYKEKLMKAENDMDDLKTECTHEYNAFSQTLVEKPKLWTKSNFCTKKSLETVAIRLRYLADLTRKIKEHCKVNKKQLSTQCPDGWKTYGNSCYFFATQTKNWTEASEYCQKHGSYLVIVENERENNFLKTTVQKIHGVMKDEVFYFMGGSGSYIKEKWKWVWPKTGQQISFENWCPEEPSKGLQHCLVLGGFCEFGWDNLQCNRAEKFICEKDAVLL